MGKPLGGHHRRPTGGLLETVGMDEEIVTIASLREAALALAI
jgi:hypothetical protein